MRSLAMTELNLFFEKPRQQPTPPTGQASSSTKGRQEYDSLAHPNTRSVSTTPPRSIWGDAPLFISDIRVEMRQCPKLTEQVKVYINDHQYRFKMGSTWIDAKMHFSVCDKFVPRSTPVRSSSVALNPNAAPFVSTRSAKSGPILCANEPAWFAVFCAGTQGSCVTSKFGDLAHHLTDFREWDASTIMELAKYFCWKGGEGITPHQEIVADFAKEVRLRFAGTWYGEEFVWKMREYAVSAFKAIWTANRPTLATDVGYISSALGITIFIGDLFTRELLPASQVHICLSFLSEQVRTIEHIHATHLLLMHAGRKVWGVQTACDFVASFTERVRATKGGCQASMIPRKTVTENDVADSLREIHNMVYRWKTQGYTGSLNTWRSRRSIANDVFDSELGQLF